MSVAMGLPNPPARVPRLTIATREAKGVLEARFTPLQGQYLAFIRAFTVIHRVAPSEAEMQRFFGVTPPSVHRMVLLLEERGWVERVPGKARSLRVLVTPEDLPMLQDPRINDVR
jgi:DNA-binding MarR family transcriptional regulator